MKSLDPAINLVESFDGHPLLGECISSEMNELAFEKISRSQHEEHQKDNQHSITKQAEQPERTSPDEIVGAKRGLFDLHLRHAVRRCDVRRFCRRFFNLPGGFLEFAYRARACAG